MLETLVTALTGDTYLKYLSIPLLAAFVGWSTNWLAIKLTFWPINFIGIPPWLGWQGIIPSKVEKMASIVVDQTVSKLGTLYEFFNEMQPDIISAHIEHYLKQRIEEYTDEVMREKNSVLWENLPLVVKNRVYSRTRKQLPSVIKGLVEDIGEHIEEIVDLKHMIVSQLAKDKVLMNRVFQEVGEAEFRFVINSGFWFGFLFGIVQMLVWILYPSAWVLPFFGLMVGLATNWIALNCIFRPLNPTKVMGFSVQGLFLKRQKEVAEVFCRLVTSEILTIKHLMTSMINGPRKDRAQSLIKKHIKPIIETGTVRTMAQIVVGPEGYANLKKTIEEKAFEVSTDPFEDVEFNKDRALVVAKMFQHRMERLSPEDFQDLLRPAFQEDEWILIAVGGLLGLMAGTFQFIFLFGGNLL